MFRKYKDAVLLGLVVGNTITNILIIRLALINMDTISLLASIIEKIK